MRWDVRLKRDTRGVIDGDTHLLFALKIVIPLLEWSGVLVIIGFLFHFENFLNAQN